MLFEISSFTDGGAMTICSKIIRRLKLQDLFEAYDSQRPWVQQGMKHICLQSSFKNRNMNKTELDEAVKHVEQQYA